MGLSEKAGGFAAFVNRPKHGRQPAGLRVLAYC